jgi:hypothetical protein
MVFAKLNIACMMLIFIFLNLLSMDSTINLPVDKLKTIRINNKHTTEMVSLAYSKFPSYVCYIANLANNANIKAVQNSTDQTILVMYWKPPKNEKNQEGYIIDESIFHTFEKIKQDAEESLKNEIKWENAWVDTLFFLEDIADK